MHLAKHQGEGEEQRFSEGFEMIEGPSMER